MASSSQKPQTEIPSPIVSSENLGWESIIVEEFQQPPGSGEFGSCQEHIITLCLATKPHRIWQAMGDRSYIGVYSKGDLSITPAELPSSYRAYGNDHYLQIRIPPQFLKQVATEAIDSDPHRLELVTEFRVRNLQIEQLAMMIRTELYQGSGGVGQLYIESLANALVVNLLRDYSGTKPRVAIYEGGLSDRQLLQVTDYINNHLAQSIKLKDLAASLGISQFYFSRLFKKSTGISLQSYVIQQRIELAKQLLKKEDISIADVALECGFNSQSHLGKYFRELMGLTPRAYRNSH
ncbi:helix-turn-helix transcriptional regulator [Pleurocapsales cyanobacterium LEGE 06147]|nr:helix-turn-helix transcriptional regulator [Pleurocapsales cyanobacterium LEGE 06147]